MDLREMLEEEGFDVVGEAADGRKAVDLAREHEPDLVILDIKMPGMNGIRAAEIITREKIAAVVILTAFSQRDLAAQAAQAGAMAYVVKPFQKSDLLPAIEVALERYGDMTRLRARSASSRTSSRRASSSSARRACCRGRACPRTTPTGSCSAPRWTAASRWPRSRVWSSREREPRRPRADRRKTRQTWTPARPPGGIYQRPYGPHTKEGTCAQGGRSSLRRCSAQLLCSPRPAAPKAEAGALRQRIAVPKGCRRSVVRSCRRPRTSNSRAPWKPALEAGNVLAQAKKTVKIGYIGDISGGNSGLIIPFRDAVSSRSQADAKGDLR